MKLLECNILAKDRAGVWTYAWIDAEQVSAIYDGFSVDNQRVTIVIMNLGQQFTVRDVVGDFKNKLENRLKNP